MSASYVAEAITILETYRQDDEARQDALEVLRAGVREQLTPVQREVLTALVRLTEENDGRPPSTVRLAEELGRERSRVSHLLARIAEKGHVRRVDGRYAVEIDVPEVAR